MKIPLKTMFKWNSKSFAPSLLGVWFIIYPWFTKGVLTPETAIFGFTFFAIGLISAGTKAPTLIASLLTAFLGINYFLYSMNAITSPMLWTFSMIMFAVVLVFEFGIFKIGPSTVQAKDLAIVPLTLLGFAILLGLAGINPYITINWNRYILVGISYLALMVFCFLFVFERVGYRPFGKNTVTWLNIMAIATVALTLFGASGLP